MLLQPPVLCAKLTWKCIDRQATSYLVLGSTSRMPELLIRYLFLLGMGFAFLPSPGVVQAAQFETRQDVQDAISRYCQLIENTPEDSATYVKRADALSLGRIKALFHEADKYPSSFLRQLFTLSS